MKNDISIVVENQLCTACGACKVVCPTKAISIQKTEIGRFFACIQADACTNCGICYDVCSGYDAKNNVLIDDSIDPFEGLVKNTYVGISTNKVIYQNAQSGGLVTECLTYLFDTKRIDAAVVCITEYGKERPSVQAAVVRNKEQLLLSQGSSYTPIDMLSALENVEEQEKIALVGLPCHIQGIVALQRKYKKHNNIVFKLGLICDRTLSETIIDVFFEIYWKKKIYWRKKNLYHNYKTAPVIMETNVGDRKTIPAIVRLNLKDYFTSPRCRICFDKMNIHADIVFGDPWGMSDIDWKNGESLVITRTNEGESLIQNLIQDRRAKLNIASFEEAKQGQGVEKRKTQIKTFFDIYREKGWLLPSYADKLSQSLIVSLPYERHKKMIDDYVRLEKTDRNTIVNEISKRLKQKLLKSKIKNVIRVPFQALKKAVKLIQK